MPNPEITRAPETRAGLWMALGLSLVIKAVLLVALADESVNRDGFIYIAAAQKFAQAEVAQALARTSSPTSGSRKG